MEAQAKEIAKGMAKDMAQEMVNDILFQRGNVFPHPRSPRGDEERCFLQEKQSYMDSFIQCEAEKRAHEIACQKLLLGGDNGSPNPSPPLRVTRHMSPSQYSRGNRRQPSPPPRYQQRKMSRPRNSQQHPQFTTHGFGVDYDLLEQEPKFQKYMNQYIQINNSQI